MFPGSLKNHFFGEIAFTIEETDLNELLQKFKKKALMNHFINS